MKKTKLSKLELFFIENSELTPQEIATELNRSVEEIQNHLSKEETKIKIDERIKRFFATSTRNGKSSGVVMMTETGSELSDKKKTKIKENKKTNCIHYIKNNVR